MLDIRGGEAPADMGPLAASRLAILPDTSHVRLVHLVPIIVPMVNDFLDAKPLPCYGHFTLPSEWRASPMIVLGVAAGPSSPRIREICELNFLGA